jgi:GT2 family glycosyltransferase
VEARGKFLVAGAEQLCARGVTYGTFSGLDGFPTPEVVAEDFEAMAESGVNAVRTYTAPPRWLLDAAAARGLRVLVGIAWEQHLAFLDDRARREAIVETVRSGVEACAGHPAVLAYAIGNEIPTSIVRWHGAARIERFLRRLATAARRADPGALVTYVNYPSTEYLELPFLDFVAFNVYLERPAAFTAYVARLQALAGDRPLVIAELGLDSQRHGDQRQALAVGRQLRDAFDGGCAGAFAFAWTDEWVRDGTPVTDWSFGLVDRDRAPKPALAAARRAFDQAQAPSSGPAPTVSVIVCTHNGAATLTECLDGVSRLRYPDVEVIVVDDGSTDATAQIASGYEQVRLISTQPRGLSGARNTGVNAARGEIVAFLDDDCSPDPDWLRFAVARLRAGQDAGVGGPNIPPASEGPIARCVARAPGGPTHVLMSATQAEHVAGCNMLFWRDALLAVGAFDERFRQAGDDVDLCWRIHEAELTLGFCPSAVVWHRRRASIRAYLRQQRGYGHAEALLERKWPERHNGAGHVTWNGQVYGGSLRRGGRRAIDYGVWGQGLFQSACQPRAAQTGMAPVTPEWYLALLGMATAAAVSPWVPLLRLPVVGLPVAVAALAVALLALLAHTVRAAAWVTLAPGLTGARRARETALVALLALLQPLARLRGRMGAGLTPWRQRPAPHGFRALTRSQSMWFERGHGADEWLTALEQRLRSADAVVTRGGRYDRWDLSVRVGALGAARAQLAIEEHGHGRQLLHWRVTARPAARWLGAVPALALLAAGEALTAGIAAALLATVAALAIALRIARDCLAAGAAVQGVLAAREGSAVVHEQNLAAPDPPAHPAPAATVAELTAISVALEAAR